MALTLDTVVKRRADLVTADMNGETVMMDLVSGGYYNLGSVGGAIWEMVEEPTRVADLVDLLLERFDVERDRCQSEVLAFLDSSVGFGIVEVVS